MRMTDAPTRKRQPEVTQQKLLEVAGDLVAEAGVVALTLDAVARRAGVSKGGLLHHFPSKTALLTAMVEDMADRFFGAVAAQTGADPDPRCRSARAYVRTTVSEPGCDGQRWAALSAAFMADPSLLEGWRARLAALRAVDRAETDDPIGALIARLAADGLWYADMCRLYDIDEETRRQLLDRLVAMTTA
jgi:AcrR family transcriptional regulator